MQTEARWNRLLDKIEDGKVIPIVGRDLLTIPANGTQVDLYRHVAGELARRLTELADEPIAQPAENLGARDPINEVASSWLATGGELRDLYDELGEVMDGLEGVPAPPSLRQLAEIEGFSLFVTTTFDGLMETALREARPNAKPQVVKYFPSAEQTDLPTLWESTGDTYVYHLMGRYSSAAIEGTPEFAVTEEETLEFVHSLQRKPGGPAQLLKELGEKQLLMLGVAFPDWLMRFVIRMSNGERRLSESKTGRAMLPRKAAQVDPALIAFLDRFSRGFDILEDYTAASFVEELGGRWRQRRDAQGPEPVSSAPPRDVFVFLSYANEDRKVVEEIRSGLRQAGITAWFDEDRLEGGDDLNGIIKSAITGCTLFVIVLSQHSLTPGVRWFRKEWAWARDVQPMLPANARDGFIVPVVVDEVVTPHDEQIDSWVRGLKWLPKDRFLTDAVELFRKQEKMRPK